jgi:hypothetical protein
VEFLDVLPLPDCDVHALNRDVYRTAGLPYWGLTAGRNPGTRTIAGNLKMGELIALFIFLKSIGKVGKVTNSCY